MYINLEIEDFRKATGRSQSDHLKNIRELKKDYPKVGARIVVSLEKQVRQTEDGILILPYTEFVKKLWAGELG